MVRNVFSPKSIRWGFLLLGLVGLAQLICLPHITNASRTDNSAQQAQEYSSCKCKQKSTERNINYAATSGLKQYEQEIGFNSSNLRYSLSEAGTNTDTAEIGLFRQNLQQQSSDQQASKSYIQEKSFQDQDQLSPSAVNVTLTSGVPVSGTISAASPGSCVLGGTQYTILVPASSTQLTIRLEGNRDVDLFARFAQPIVIQSGQLIVDHASTSLSGFEEIIITPLSQPPLQQGIYHIAIGNCSTGTASFTLTATVLTSDSQTIALTSGIQVSGTVSAPNPGTCRIGATQYTIEVPFGATQLKIDLAGNQDVDILVRRGQRVAVQGGAAVADHIASSTSTSESITIGSSSSPPLQSGIYFIAVPNCGSAAANFTLTATVSVAPPPDRPNLTPFQPGGWSDRIVISNLTGTNTDSSSLSAADTLRIDWAVRNSGTAATSGSFSVRLFVDGIEKMSWSIAPPLNVGAHTFIEDHSIGNLSQGNHSIRIQVDSQNNVVESSEFDNEYTRNIVVFAQTCHTLTANITPEDGGVASISSESGCPAPAGALQRLSSVSSTPVQAEQSSPLVSESFNRSMDDLISRAERAGSMRVIVGVQARFKPEGILTPQAMAAQHNLIAEAQNRLLNSMPRVNAASLKRFRTIPFLALEVDAAGLRYLRTSPDVSSVEEDMAFSPLLAESVALIGAPAAWAQGHSGAGQAVAILDTGVDKNHPFLTGRVISEACFSTTSQNTSSVCPGGAAQSTLAGSGLHCVAGGCEHGTHVAGIAAGKGTSFSGVARDADIIAIQVFSRSDSPSVCGSEPTPCVSSFQSDVIRGLERVQALAATFNIAAVNMSLGGGKFSSACDAQLPSMKTVIDNLRSIGIATVISSGNNGFSDSLSAPACISSAISVGSTGDGSGGSVLDRVSGFSNSAGFLSLLAPGQFITSSLPLGHFETFQGTSMAAPHVAGGIAVLKSKAPSASVNQLLSALTTTGVPLLDSRNGITKTRIQVDAALNALGGGGVVPDHYIEGGIVTLTATANPGFTFVKWQRDGADFSTSPTINVTVNDSHTMTAVFSRGPVIDTAVAQTKKLFRIDGSNFGQAPKVFINGVDRSKFIKSTSTTSITLKGKLKKLGIKAGDNTIQVIGDGGAGSNIFTFTQ